MISGKRDLLESTKEWVRWGAEDPLWGVASWAGRQHGGANPWTNEDFYSLGKSDWEDFFTHWKQYGVDTGRCLEIGCGAGRITRELAVAFESVCALDVSEGMIERARLACGENVEFILTGGSQIPIESNSVTAIFSCHVLQHLDSEEITMQYFQEFHRVLRKGGTMMIHVPVYQMPAGQKINSLLTAIYAGYRRFDNLRATVKRAAGARFMRGTPIQIDTTLAFLGGLGFERVESRIFSVKSNGSAHPFIFASRR